MKRKPRIHYLDSQKNRCEERCVQVPDCKVWPARTKHMTVCSPKNWSAAENATADTRQGSPTEPHIKSAPEFDK